MTFVAYLHDFLEQVIQGCIAMSDEKDFLSWIVVIQVANDLHRHIGLSSPWRAHDHRQALVHSRTQSFHLSRGVPAITGHNNMRCR